MPPPLTRRTAGRLIVALLVLAVPACGGDGNLKTYKASGQVLLDGKPVPGVTVVLHPVDKSRFKRDERPFGKTDEAGNFALTTYESQDGAPDGEYQVAVAFEAGGPADDDGSDQAVRGKKQGPKLPARYGYADKSGLTASVPAAPTALKPFELSSK